MEEIHACPNLELVKPTQRHEEGSGSPIPLLLAGGGTICCVLLFVFLVLDNEITIASGVFGLLIWISFLGLINAFAHVRGRLRARLTLIGAFGFLVCLSVTLYVFAYP